MRSALQIATLAAASAVNPSRAHLVFMWAASLTNVASTSFDHGSIPTESAILT